MLKALCLLFVCFVSSPESEGKDLKTLPPAEAFHNPSVPDPVPERNVWDRLADCESGNWIDGGASFETGSARWDWPLTLPPWGTKIHHGGLQFHPDTWDWLKPDGYPQYAYQATREQQIVVAERVLEVQSWKAWPVCSRKLGLRRP